MRYHNMIQIFIKKLYLDIDDNDIKVNWFLITEYNGQIVWCDKFKLQSFKSKLNIDSCLMGKISFIKLKYATNVLWNYKFYLYELYFFKSLNILRSWYLNYFKFSIWYKSV